MKSAFVLMVTALVLSAAIPAAAIPMTYTVTFSGSSESPPNASPGIGTAVVTIDAGPSSSHILNIVSDSFSGLLGTTTASHIHCCTAIPGTGTASVATQTPSFTGFPLGVTSGTYSMAFDLTLSTTYNPAYVTANGGTPAGAEAALAAGAALGEAYLNIHTTVVPGGEIRGFLTPAVPEPTSLLLLGSGLVGARVRRWRRRRDRMSRRTPDLSLFDNLEGDALR